MLTGRLDNYIVFSEQGRFTLLPATVPTPAKLRLAPPAHPELVTAYQDHRLAISSETKNRACGTQETTIVQTKENST